MYSTFAEIFRFHLETALRLIGVVIDARCSRIKEANFMPGGYKTKNGEYKDLEYRQLSGRFSAVLPPQSARA
jgi:hypothetical protein